MIRNFSFSAGLWENDSPQAPPWKRVVNKQFSGKGVCSLQRCLGNLTLNNTDVWFPTGGNGFIMFQRSPVCAGLLYSPVFGLDCPLALYISAIKEAGLGALVVFFFFFPLSLPCGVLNCLPADVIQPLRNSFCLARLNDSSHSQRLGVRFWAGGRNGNYIHR